MVTRAQIIEAARKYIGVPWRHQGRNPKTGLDCAGLVVTVAHELGISNYDFTTYRRAPDGTFSDHFARNMVQKPITQAQPGDVLLFAQGIYACHCAIVSEKNGDLYIIHGYEPFTKVHEEPYTGKWMNSVTHCFSFPGVHD